MQKLALALKYPFSYKNFGRLTFDPFEKSKPPSSQEGLKETV